MKVLLNLCKHFRVWPEYLNNIDISSLEELEDISGKAHPFRSVGAQMRRPHEDYTHCVLLNLLSVREGTMLRGSDSRFHDQPTETVCYKYDLPVLRSGFCPML